MTSDTDSDKVASEITRAARELAEETGRPVEEFVADEEIPDIEEQEIVTDGGSGPGGSQLTCDYCDGSEVVYELRSDRGPVCRCLTCLAIERGGNQFRSESPEDFLSDEYMDAIYDDQDHYDESRIRRIVWSRDWYTILARIQQDDPLIKRDPDDFGTVDEAIREFLTNFMGADAHKRPSEIAPGVTT